MNPREELYAAKARSNKTAALLLAGLVIMIMVTFMTLTRYRAVEKKATATQEASKKTSKAVEQPSKAETDNKESK